MERNAAARPIPVWLLSLTVFLLLLLPVAAHAQPATGALRGLVRDASGGPLPGAIVGLNTDGGMIDSAVTDETGAFEFPAVDAGRYTVRVALINFTGVVRNVNVEAGAAATVKRCCTCRSTRTSRSRARNRSSISRTSNVPKTA